METKNLEKTRVESESSLLCHVIVETVITLCWRLASSETLTHVAEPHNEIMSSTSSYSLPILDSLTSISWDDRKALQNAWTLQEKGWLFDIEWKETKFGLGAFASQHVSKSDPIRVGEFGGQEHDSVLRLDKILMAFLREELDMKTSFPKTIQNTKRGFDTSRIISLAITSTRIWTATRYQVLRSSKQTNGTRRRRRKRRRTFTNQPKDTAPHQE